MRGAKFEKLDSREVPLKKVLDAFLTLEALEVLAINLNLDRVCG